MRLPKRPGFELAQLLLQTGALDCRDQCPVHGLFGFHWSHFHGLCPGILTKNGAQGNDFFGLIRSPERRDGATEGFVLDSWDKFVFCIFKQNASSVHSMEEKPSSIQHIKPENPG
jgi:hypothetical protein